MKKGRLLFVFMFVFTSVFSQVERYPVFKNCDSLSTKSDLTCFKKELHKAFTDEFKIPEILTKEDFKGQVNIVFSVDDTGNFDVIYVNSPYKELKAEVERVFGTFDKITPAKYNNNPVEMQFVYPLMIPLDYNFEEEALKKLENLSDDKGVDLAAKLGSTLFPEHQSELNIPFTHLEYNQIEYILNQHATTHTAMKPYTFASVNKYIDLDSLKNRFVKNKKTWFGRKLFNEHMAYVKSKDFWFTIDPVVDLQVGTDNENEKTFINTRGIKVNGGLGKNLNFSTSFYESQARFANFVNNYAELIKPDGGQPAMIPGRGVAKLFKKDAYDFPVSEAYLSYTPSKYFNFQFGHGKHFIGDGYRSLFVSDVSSPMPYFKINTQFWKLNYTNVWMWGQDVRRALTVDGAFKKKFMAMHYLSWNVSKKLNLGFFETVIWDNANDRGFDINYVNPLIFYYSTEISTGTRAGNAIMGLSAKYKLKKNINLYSQLLIDEFRVSEIGSGNGWWGNKTGIQLGAKYFDAFNVENLFLQMEYNSVRPFTYSHDELNYNFGHNNQPVAHLWGANFNEFIAIANYTKDKWYASVKLITGKKGFDYDIGSDDFSYGGNIYADNDNRKSDFGNDKLQGNVADIFIGDFQLGYLLNPATNLKLFTGVTIKNFDSKSPIVGFNNSNATWFTVGLKTDLFNWYFDF